MELRVLTEQNYCCTCVCMCICILFFRMKFEIHLTHNNSENDKIQNSDNINTIEIEEKQYGDK